MNWRQHGRKTLENAASRLEPDYDCATPQHSRKFPDPPQHALSVGIALLTSYRYATPDLTKTGVLLR